MSNKQQQDDSFLYFAITIVVVILMPLTFYILKHPFRSFISHSYRRHPLQQFIPQDNPKFQKKLKLDQAERRFNWYGSGYIFALIVWIIMVLVFINIWQQLPDPETSGLFDPFEILGVSRSASGQEVRKAYRKLALAYHPDKSIGKEKEFIRVTKAYECLENPTKLANCERFGNPEGHHNFSIGIALPSFIVESKNKALYLLAILITFGSIIVGLLYQTVTSIGKYDNNQILSSNIKIIAKFFQKNKTENLSEGIELISNLHEFDKFPEKRVAQLMDDYFNHKELQGVDQKNLYHILKIAPRAFQSVFQIGLNIIRQALEQEEPIKQQLIKFSQQLLHFITFQQQIIQCSKDIKQDITYKPIIQVETSINHFDPDLSVEELTSTDLFFINYQIKLLRTPQFTESEYYPFLQENSWIILLTYDDIIFQAHQVKEFSIKNGITNKFKVMPYEFSMDKSLKKYKFKIIVRSNSYIGQDIENEIVIDCKPADIKGTNKHRKNSDSEYSDEDNHQSDNSEDNEREDLKRQLREVVKTRQVRQQPKQKKNLQKKQKQE